MSALAVLGLGARAGGASFTVAPAAAWVEELPLPTDAVVPSREVTYGRYYLIDDFQAQVATTTARYHRRAWQVLSTAGVQEASEIRMDFDPSYERLIIHDVRLWRGGRNVRAFKPADVELLHQEDELSERIYNGSLTALVFLKDVRPGDIVDYAFTVEGDNPIMEGRYFDEAALAYGVPLRHRRYRVTLPATRPLTVKAHRSSLEPEVRESGGRRTYTWEARDVPALDVDEDLPDWYEPYPAIRVSEFRSWNEVARWARRLHLSQQRQPSPEVSALAARWRAAAGDEEGRALQAIRFVQD
ncbi:MAG TPA: DUF3857 domain-containing protein, partial [Vicinamibacteria bacterium]